MRAAFEQAALREGSDGSRRLAFAVVSVWVALAGGFFRERQGLEKNMSKQNGFFWVVFFQERNKIMCVLF